MSNKSTATAKLRTALTGKVVENVETDFNTVVIYFEGGAHITLQANGYQGTKLEVNVTYPCSESIEL